MKVSENISMLRKSGRLDEAYRLATDWYKARPKDPWRQIALFWVLRDLSREALARRKSPDVTSYLDTMATLLPTLPDTKGAAERAYQALIAQTQPDFQLIQTANALGVEDPLAAFEMVKGCYTHFERIHCSLHESLGWILYRYLRQQKEVLPSLSIRKALALYLKLSNPRPSRLHSLILNFALVYSREHPDLKLRPFFLLWDPAKLQAEDLLPAIRNNTSYPSLLAQVLQRIAPQMERKQVLELVTRLPFSREQSLDYVRQAFLDELILLSRQEETDALWRSFNRYTEVIPLDIPSKAHTGVLLLAHQLMQGDEDWRFVRFWLQWGVRGLREEDWYPGMDGRQKREPSVVETVARHALSSLFSHSIRSADLLEQATGLFREIAERARPAQWAIHGLAILSTKQGRQEEAISYYRRILLENPGDYRYWLGLSQVVRDKPETHVAICCKVLLLERDPSKIGDLRLELAQSLLAIGQSAEALTELRQYRAEQPQPPAIYQRLLQGIETRVTILPSLGGYYERRAPQAEEFIAEEYPLRKFVLISWVNQADGRVARLSDGGDILLNVAEGRFPLLRTLRCGAVVKMRVRETTAQDPTMIDSRWEPSIAREPLSCALGNDPAWSILPIYQATVVRHGPGGRQLGLRTDDGQEVAYYTDERPAVGSRVSFRGYYQPLKAGKRLEVATLVRNV